MSETEREKEIIDLVDDDDEVLIVESRKRKASGTETIVVDQDDEEIEVIEVFQPLVAAAENNCIDCDEVGEESDVQVVGTLNAVMLPHMRCHCTVHPLVVNLRGSAEQNKTHCDLCYCYVCDVPVKDCLNWDQHCQAYDKSEHWKSERKHRGRHVLQAVFRDGRILKWIIEIFRNHSRLTKQAVTLYCSNDDVVLQSIGSKSVSLLEIRLTAPCFSLYRCSQDIQLGIPDLNVFYKKALKGAKKKFGPLTLKAHKDSLKMAYEQTLSDDTPTPLEFRLDSGSCGHKWIFPVMKDKCYIRMSTEEFKKVIHTFYRLCSSGLVTITCTKDAFHFSYCPDRTEDDSCLVKRACFTYKNSVETRYVFDCDNTVEKRFSLRYLASYVKIVGALASSVIITVSPGRRLTVEYPFCGENGQVCFYLAPSIGE